MPRRSISQDYGRYAGVVASAVWHLALLWAVAAYVVRPFRPRLDEMDVSIVPAPMFTPRLSRPKTVATPRPLSPRRPVSPAPSPAAAPIVGAPIPAAPSASPDQPPQQPDAGVNGRVRDVLRRSLGCTDTAVLGLSEGEKKACAAQAEARATEAAAMPLARLEPNVRAYYDAVDHAYHEGNLPGASCAAGQGKLHCKIIPPHGVLTEELGLTPP